MTTYASNKNGNSIMVDTQEWEELQALVKRQRVIIEMYNRASAGLIWLGVDSTYPISGPLLKAAYAAAQDITGMTDKRMNSNE